MLGFGLGTSSAKSLPTPDQTAVQAQRASYMTVPAAKQDALPAAYQSKLTEMTTEVRDYDGGFKLTIPWRVTGGVYTDKDLKGDAAMWQGIISPLRPLRKARRTCCPLRKVIT